MFKWLKRILIGIGLIVALLVIALAVAFGVAEPQALLPPTLEHDNGLPFIEAGGYRFHGETFGDQLNPTVIVLHGGPGGDYRALMSLKKLSNNYFVVFYDQRGSGLSPRVGVEELTIEVYLEDLHAIANKYAPTGKVSLIGHSFGGMLASAYLGRHPEKVAGAVLAEPGFLTPQMGQLLMERTNWMTPTGLGLPDLWTMGRIWLESWKHPQLDGHEQLDYLFSRIMTLDVEGHPIAGYYCDRDLSSAYLPEWRLSGLASQTMLASAINENRRVIADFSTGIDQFEGAVLFIAASCNTLIGESVQQEHLKLFQNARLEVIQGAGHTMFGEKPDESLSIVRKYLGEVLN